uniref:Dynein intermediate chain 1, axonemal n=1 Tax=Chromera velia CCMP2878 TaxID=1169474 RepID=A0A0G4HQU8_9ALVE|eukprot:Cvel_30473.t1-p1 / transcript=Cvel_30473.t1 / gene=Cvel_30473 / organism=Chromera_velia_CCMP2878 / gene_product=Dynein intermediate chain 2, ciliary, putative / transcript_product=Dynein intermediate chain 2, ciliary, putative / location=Cvel_scaffold4351:190-6583(-) / protein_length=508 / sequence_SO=supercontig / SO=protein_coding / is_pseudo=false
MPPKPAGKAKPGGGAGHDGGGQDDEMGDNFDANVPVVLHVEPKDQVKGLNKEDLEKELNRVLYPQNPQAPQNFTEFSYKERGYKKDDQVEQTVFHLSLEGGVLLEGSDEANEQEEMKKRKEEEMKKKEEAEAVDVEIDEDPDSKDNTKRLLRSQFRFSDRASQTFNPTLKSRGIMTEPPPTSRFTSTVTQWAIFDRYMEDILEAQQRESNESKAKRKEGEEEKEKGDKKETKKKQDPLYSGEMRHALKIMERLVNQNAENEIYMDFKYFEDLSDEFREGDGTLLPLWRFASEKTKRKQVTAIAWSPKYPDLFAVGLGSYDFLKQGGGVVCCYTLKNTTHPEYLFNVEAGVCSLDWHPAYAQLLCVGLYDGTVLVFDVQSGSKRPLYASSVKSKKHTDPVWEVRWNNDETSANLNFYSVSSDGRVSSWSLMKKALEPDEVMELKLAPSPSAPAEEEEISLSGLAGGTCLDFSPFHDHLFVVGTEEGRIHKCSKAYSGQYLETYDGQSVR